MEEQQEKGCLCWNCGNLGKCPRLSGFSRIKECAKFSEILNVIEICKILDISERTFYRYCKDKVTLDYIKHILYNRCGYVLEKELCDVTKNKVFYYAYKITL